MKRILNKTYYGFKRWVHPGDRVQLRWTDDATGIEEVVLEELVTEDWCFDAAVIFLVGEGEYDPNVKGGMGGAFLDTDGKGFANETL